MRIFISYKFTGVPLEQIHALVDPVMEALKEYQPYCNLYDDKYYGDNKMTKGQIMNHVLGKLRDSELHISLVNGELGEGMSIEFGYALKIEIPQIVCIKRGTKVTSCQELAGHCLEYDTVEELIEKLVNTVNLIV